MTQVHKHSSFMLVFTGPTGVGKSDVALAVAKKIPAEIINADMGQCYTPLTIGTAKPDWRNLPVPHHLFDIQAKPVDMTVVEYREQLMRTIAQVVERNHIPIIVGGSGFYIKSLFFPPSVSASVPYEEQGQENLWQMLHNIDPERAATLHPNDMYRIKRALAIWQQTGKKPSHYAPVYQPSLPFYCAIFTRERDDLYARIDERVVAMMKHGWMQEVEKLRETAWEPFLLKKKIIGYDTIIRYAQSDATEMYRDELIAHIQQKTRNYAKRQLTFFKMLERQITKEISASNDVVDDFESSVEVVNLTLVNLDLYIERLLKRIEKLLNKKF